jgi:hypothetical protein
MREPEFERESYPAGRAIPRRYFLQEVGVASSAALFLPRLGLAQAADQPSGLPGGNPIMPGTGMCDPHARVFGDAVYVYASHDMSPADREKAPPPAHRPVGSAGHLGAAAKAVRADEATPMPHPF